MKVDDDVLINPAGLANIKREVLDKFREKNSIFGFPVHNSSRHKYGKYSAKKFLREKFPSFVLGPFYILTAVAVKNIVNAGLDKMVSVPLEDVAITGVLRQIAGADIVSIKDHMVPSLDFVYGLIQFFSGDLDECVKHVAEYSVIHCQLNNVKNITKEEEERMVNWIWTSVWKN